VAFGLLTEKVRKRIGHLAPFPKELPYRAIKLFSYVGNVVFDPFSGSGTTTLIAAMNKRIGIGLDIDVDYCRLAENRLLDTFNGNLEVLWKS
jgi:site-specific DNA-methyltransferase (adenine-specific)